MANGVLYTVEYDNQVHAYDALSGAALWQGSIQSYWYAPGAVLDAGSLYIAAGDNLYAFRLPS